MGASRIIVPACALLALTGLSEAQSVDKDAIKQPGPPALRYRFSHTSDGVMRLDGQTGQVMLCRSQGGAFICKVVPEGAPVVQAQLNPGEGDKEKTGDQPSELPRQLGVLEEDRMALKAALEAIQSDNNALKTELGSLRQDIAALKNAIAAQDRGGAERDAQRGEISRLTTENAELKERLAALQKESEAMQKQIAALQPAPETPPVPPAPVPAPKSQELKLPSQAELDQARAAIVEAWKRVVEMMNTIRKDLTGKSDDAPVRL
jgi:regulator of replication initiation timing